MGLNEFLDNKESNELMPIVNQIITLEQQLEEAKKVEIKVKEMKEELKSLMKDNNVYKWETPNGIKITLVDDKEDTEEERVVIDENEFIKNEQAIRDAYMEARKKYEKVEKVIVKGRKGYVKITLPKGE